MISVLADEILVPTVGPAEVADLVDLSTDSQRDWRRRGLLDEHGRQDANGRWRYSVLETFTMWIARRLTEARFDISDAMILAYVAANKLLASENTFLLWHDREKLDAKESKDTELVTRYIVAFNHEGALSYIETDNLMDLFKSRQPVFFVVDLWDLAEATPVALVQKAFPEIG